MLLLRSLAAQFCGAVDVVTDGPSSPQVNTNRECRPSSCVAVVNQTVICTEQRALAGEPHVWIAPVRCS